MTKEEKCPTCGGPAIDRSEYWETCWEPVPPPKDNLLAELRRQLAEKDKVIAKFDFDVVPRLMDEIQMQHDRITSLEAVIDLGLTVSQDCIDEDALFVRQERALSEWRNQAVAAIDTQPQAVEIPQPEVTARVDGKLTSPKSLVFEPDFLD